MQFIKSKTPTVGFYIDAEEKAFIESFESDFVPPESGLTSDRRAELEAMARATPRAALVMSEPEATDSMAAPERD